MSRVKDSFSFCCLSVGLTAVFKKGKQLLETSTSFSLHMGNLFSLHIDHFFVFDDETSGMRAGLLDFHLKSSASKHTGYLYSWHPAKIS